MSGKKIRRCNKDEVIFREGDEGDCAYLIEAGRVLIYLDDKEHEVPLRIVGQGEVFGEMSLIDASPRSASCRAVTECHLIVVSKQQLLDRITAVDPVVRLLMQVLLDRLRSQNDLIRGKGPGESKVGRNDPLEAEKKAALERIGLEHRIASGLDDDEFIPFYQPIYDLRTGELCGCEALIRWIGKDGTVVMPDLFMDVMEETYLILRGGQVMIEKSLRDLPKMLSHFVPASGNFFVSINVSGRQFTDPSFIEHIETVRKRTGVPAELIKLELTERIMTEGTQALATLHECRKLGYLLAIDDFGTGFSSLQYLAQMPLTDLKIDRGFIHKMQFDVKSLSVVKSLIFMANLLKLRTIAEGVETTDQLALLRDLGAQEAQGFHFARPLAFDKFMQLPKRFSV
jgi:EAL domain-containing protein (putative c-di-GMP-specific phosphodiesterase class I)